MKDGEYIQGVPPQLDCSSDDNQIIDFLAKYPTLNVPPFNGRTIVQFLLEDTKGKDFGMVLPDEDQYFAFYKYGKIGDSGFLLLRCDKEDWHILLQFLVYERGKLFASTEVCESMEKFLVQYVDMDRGEN